MSVKNANAYDQLKKWIKRNNEVFDYLLLVVVVGGILLFGLYAEVFGGLVARFIEQIRKLFA